MRTYKKAFDLLTMAYISEAVDPWNCKACFVGNLLDNTGKWGAASQEMSFVKRTVVPITLGEAIDRFYMLDHVPQSTEYILSEGYTVEEINDLEVNFLKVIIENLEPVPEFENKHIYVNQYADPNIFSENGKPIFHHRSENPKYEEALFKAFESTLEMLKKIHISKGEVIEETSPFVKREKKTLELV